MHPRDNNTPPSSPCALSQTTVELMEGLAHSRKRAQEGWMIFQPRTEPQKAATYEPRSSWERIGSAGPILKNEGTREEGGGGGGGMGIGKVSRHVCA